MPEDTQNLPKEQDDAMSKVVLSKMYELMTAALSLVAALAWNDAIQSAFKTLFGDNNSLTAKFIYAIIITVIIVWMGSRLAKLNKAIDKRFGKNNGQNQNG